MALPAVLQILGTIFGMSQSGGQRQQPTQTQSYGQNYQSGINQPQQQGVTGTGNTIGQIANQQTGEIPQRERSFDNAEIQPQEQGKGGVAKVLGTIGQAIGGLTGGNQTSPYQMPYMRREERRRY